MDLEALKIEEFTILTAPDIHSVFIIQMICYLLEHHAEEIRSQDTTFLHAVCDGKGLRLVTIKMNQSALAHVQLDHNL